MGCRWVGVVDEVRWDAFQKDFEVEEMYRTKPALKTGSPPMGDRNEEAEGLTTKTVRA